MGITVHQENEITILRLTGQFIKSELDAVQSMAAKDFAANPKLLIKMLLIVEDFKGWQAGVDWGEMSFYFEHGDKITKIALVSDPKRQAELMMFLGSGIRSAPVKAFLPTQAEQAKQWLLDNKLTK